jgi:uncharacterized lipoprotein YmbA
MNTDELLAPHPDPLPVDTGRGSISETIFRIACCCALIALAGCGVTGPSPKTNFYMLSVEAEPARSENAAARPAGAPVRVSVSRVAIPGIVDRPQIVARVASNNVEIFDFHRWAEPLQEAIPRVIAGDLSAQLGSGYSVAAGVMPGLPPDLRISVDVQRFEAVMGTGVTVDALWSVRPATGEARTGRSVIEERVPEGGHAGIAAAYSRALASVAREIAAVVAATPISRSTGSRPCLVVHRGVSGDS